MNYKESSEIFKLVKKSKNILLNCHENLDLDSLSSAVSLYQVLTSMDKKVTIVSTDGVPKELKFIDYSEKVEPVKFSEFDFKEYDLFIVTDTASWERVVGSGKIKTTKIPIAVIDHHKTNTRFGKVNLVDADMSSTAELLYYVFQDWKIKVDATLATALLAGVIADTDTFRYRSANAKTLKSAAGLMELGADKQRIIFNYYRMHDPLIVKFIGEILGKIEVDKKAKFVWAAIPYKIFKKYKDVEVGKDLALDNFARSIKNTNFALLMTEKSPGSLSVSFRAREEVDISKIAVSLGGGGHKAAAGAKIEGLDFDAAVIKVLEKARKYAENY